MLDYAEMGKRRSNLGCYGADGGTRTRTRITSQDFKSRASTIPPHPHGLGPTLAYAGSDWILQFICKKFRAGVARDNHSPLGPTPRGVGRGLYRNRSDWLGRRVSHRARRQEVRRGTILSSHHFARQFTHPDAYLMPVASAA